VDGFRLETERLILREWAETDRDAFASVINTPAAMRHFGGIMTPEQCAEFLDKRMADQRRHGMSYWAVTLRESGALVGSCGLRVADNYPADLPIANMIEAGWRIGEDFWRQGFATEAMRAAFAWLWDSSEVQTVGAWTTLQNIPSQRTMQKLGMARRMDLDFDHPAIPQGNPLRRHLVYTIERPQ
jgi:RimJ/RimL family protein N-acetyltransferase